MGGPGQKLDDLAMTDALLRCHHLAAEAAVAFMRLKRELSLDSGARTRIALLGPTYAAIDAVEDTSLRMLAALREAVLQTAECEAVERATRLQTIEANIRHTTRSCAAERAQLRALERDLVLRTIRAENAENVHDQARGREEK